MRRPDKASGKAVKAQRRKAPNVAGRSTPSDADPNERIALLERRLNEALEQLTATSGVRGQLPAAFEDVLADHIWGTALAKSDLQSAFDHWNEWRWAYQYNAYWWGGAFFFVLLVFLFIFYYVLAWHGNALLIDKVDTGVALQRIAIFGAIVALIVWTLHQLLRMWAFFEDMRNDAIERIGLLTAFAALKGANWLTAADVPVALTALFRSRRSSIEAPGAPATSFDTIGKHAGEAVKKAKGD
jgi:hypothetical protein